MSERPEEPQHPAEPKTPERPADASSGSGSTALPPPGQDQPGHAQPYGQPPAAPGYPARDYGPAGYAPGPGSYDQPPQPYGPPGPYGPPSGPVPYGQPGQGPAPYGYPTSGYPGAPAYGPVPLSPADERLWATLAHISVPFFGFIGPLVIYLVFKDRSPRLKDNAVEALNFSILYSIALILCIFLSFIVVGLVLLPLVSIAALVFAILGAIAANRGEVYRYPVNWRLVK